MDKFGKIRRHHWKESLKISETATFESDLLKTNENTTPQSCEVLQTFVWREEAHKLEFDLNDDEFLNSVNLHFKRRFRHFYFLLRSLRG